MGNGSSKAHEKRISRCLQSFQQLQTDIRHINVHCALEFARPIAEVAGDAAPALIAAAAAAAESPKTHDASSSSAATSSTTAAGATGADDDTASSQLILQFRPFTKLSKKSALPWLWSINNNVIVVATLTPRVVADAAMRAHDATNANATASSTTVPLPLDPALPSYSLTIREFYHVYLYFCDNLKLVTTLREQCLKIEQPEKYEALQEARRQAQTRKPPGTTPTGHEADEEEEKTPAPSSLLVRQSTTPLDCSICLSVPEEEGEGKELIVLPCLHAFCDSCLSDWRSIASSCPLCRRELNDGPDDDSDWVLTSPNLAQLRAQFDKTLTVPYEYCRKRPSFPPVDNKRSIKSAGDVFSLAVGEALDIFAPIATQRRKNTNEAAAPALGAALPVAQPVKESNAVASPAPSGETATSQSTSMPGIASVDPAPAESVDQPSRSAEAPISTPAVSSAAAQSS